MLNPYELTGRTRSHVVQRDDLRAALHPLTLEAFLDMRADALRFGIDMAIASSFRDFDAQGRIWNLKYRGERPLLDEYGQPRDYASLAAAERVDAILCWSALPGASRHHWGSDLDVVDRAAVSDEYRVQLVPSECCAGGVFERLHRWIDDHLHEYGFFRPYAVYHGGVRPELWHLSHAPVSVPALGNLSIDILREALEGSDLLGKEEVLRRLPELYDRYVLGVDVPPGTGLEPPGADRG